ncbi:conserved hypothetical protein [Theileria equi strain WA]|uniref:Charged multivesicular body protein 5 n=1 Tax=Theileria equi strain WA TaxID=1537102 RepID=L1LA57_THEEQ|nr:conserved hypothetical protein [Theileria equi strain WA]EKX72322.1 conserved hypothetical protein [Theileria equi strain WA]|eukprot:XP_004831774.1 conserved hypothetical protein [Theileria equi strain WA]
MRFLRKKPGPSLEETSGQIGEKISALDAKINACNLELAKIKTAMASARAPSATSLAKKKASEILQRRKVYETQRDSLVATQLNIDRSEYTHAQIKTANLMKDALATSLKTMKKEAKKVNLAKIEKLQDEIEDMNMYAEEISDVLGRQYEVPEDIDEGTLDLEFSMLDESILDEAFNSLEENATSNLNFDEETSQTGEREEPQIGDMSHIEGYYGTGIKPFNVTVQLKEIYNT